MTIVKSVVHSLRAEAYPPMADYLDDKADHRFDSASFEKVVSYLKTL